MVAAIRYLTRLRLPQRPDSACLSFLVSCLLMFNLLFSKILEKIYSGGVHEHKIRIMDGGESPVSSALIDGVNRQDYTLRHLNRTFLLSFRNVGNELLHSSPHLLDLPGRAHGDKGLHHSFQGRSMRRRNVVLRVNAGLYKTSGRGENGSHVQFVPFSQQWELYLYLCFHLYLTSIISHHSATTDFCP
jgi:hypothetical protein